MSAPINRAVEALIEASHKPIGAVYSEWKPRLEAARAHLLAAIEGERHDAWEAGGFAEQTVWIDDDVTVPNPHTPYTAPEAPSDEEAGR